MAETNDINYGYDGLRRIFSELDFDMQNWVSKKVDKERGGMQFKLPNADGEIYLEWGDLYRLDVTFVHSGKNFNETLSIADLKEIIKTLEEQRQRHVNSLRGMLMKAFGEKNNE